MRPDPQHWIRLFELFESVLDLPGPERSRALDESCSGDPELRAAVEEMLAEHRAVNDLSFLGNRDRVGVNSTPTLESALEGTQVGNFRLVRLIATGGMGAVFEARQDNPARTVAVKVLKPSFANGSVLRRFAVEAEILARLRHPGIAQVFASGVHSFAEGTFRFDLPWYAMEFLGDSQTLSEYARERNLTAHERISLMRQLCDSVEHAHQRGVIHRDLKPQNVLIDSTGAAKLIDFGIARDALREGERTLTGDVFGTPRYMAPEQLAGSTDVDVRTDVFALGVILYELLTRENPWAPPGATIDEVRRNQSSGKPPRPSERVPHLPKELDWIVAHTLELDPNARYPSARELGDDIGRFLRHEPTLASPPSRAHRARLFVARHRIGLAIGAIALIVNGAWIVNLKDARDRANASQALANRRLEFAERQFDKIQEVVGVIEYAIDQANAVRQGADVSMREVLAVATNALDTHIERPEVGQALAASLAEWHLALNDLARAEELAHRAIALGDATPVEFKDALRQDNAQRILARCLSERGRLAEANSIVEASKSAPTLDDKSVATVARRIDHYYSIVRNALQFARYTEAESAARAAIADLEATGMDPDGNINALELSLIQALRCQNRIDEALAVCERVGTRIEGQPRFANAVLPVWRGHRASLAFDRGEDQRAFELALANYDDCRSRLGGNSKHTLHARQTVALIALVLQRSEYAREHLEELIEMRRGDDSVRSSELASAEQLLAWAQLDLGDLDSARTTLAHVHAATPNDLPDSHPMLGLTLALEGRLALARGARDSGRELLDRAIRIVDDGYGKGNRRARILREWSESATERVIEEVDASSLDTDR